MSIRVNNMSFRYSEEALTLDGLNLTIEQGEFVLMAGPNGAGKSTILKLLNGILKPGSGTITIDNLDTRVTPTAALASLIAVTFQNPADQIFAATVRNEILFGPKILRRPNPARLADKSIELFCLGEYASNHPYDLSPAHRKLLTVASAVATDTPILAFDEPTASLSQPERLILLNALNELKREKRTLLIVSHDFDFFIPEAARLALLNAGRIIHIGSPHDLVSKPQLAKAAGMDIPLSFRIQRIAEASARGKRKAAN
jgi:energy-coupling factor transporter ATP-binding protein EcfA2